MCRWSVQTAFFWKKTCSRGIWTPSRCRGNTSSNGRNTSGCHGNTSCNGGNTTSSHGNTSSNAGNTTGTGGNTTGSCGKTSSWRGNTPSFHANRDLSRRCMEKRRALTLSNQRRVLPETSVPNRQVPVQLAAISAARTVFCRSMAMVIGPTPPGLGVIFPAMGWMFL
jgi:hypothetical protein